MEGGDVVTDLVLQKRGIGRVRFLKITRLFFWLDFNVTGTGK